MDPKMTKKPRLRLRTLVAYEELEAVLARECKHPVHVELEGLEDGDLGPRKVLTLIFESDVDRDSLRAYLERPPS